LSNGPNAAVSSHLGACPLARKDAALFGALVADYREIILLAVEEALSGMDHRTFSRVRALARRAGRQDAAPQDLVAVHLAALITIVKDKRHGMAKACVRQSRLLLVKLLGELALYYRDLARASAQVH
jgi:hypothetical protein